MGLLLALIFGALLSGGDSSRGKGESALATLPEFPLTPDELSGVQQQERLLASVRQDLESAKAAHVQAKNAADDARQELNWTRAFILVPLGILLCCVVGFAFNGHLLLTLVLVVASWRLAAYGHHVFERDAARLERAKTDQVRRLLSVARHERIVDSQASALKELQRVRAAQAEQRALMVREREKALQHAIEVRVAEQCRAAEMARHVESQLEATVQERERQRLELAESIKAAFAYWETVAQHPEEYLAIHADRLVEQEDRIVAAYQDCGVRGSTADDCLRRAKLALAQFPEEMKYWIPEKKDRTVKHVAHVLRRYNGDFRERLLPAAEKLIYQRRHSAAAAPTSRSGPVPPKPAPADGPLSDLPPEERAAIESVLRDIRTLEALDAALEEEYVRYEKRLRLRTPPLGEEEIDRALKKYATNLDKMRTDWAGTKD